MPLSWQMSGAPMNPATHVYRSISRAQCSMLATDSYCASVLASEVQAGIYESCKCRADPNVHIWDKLRVNLPQIIGYHVVQLGCHLHTCSMAP